MRGSTEQRARLAEGFQECRQALTGYLTKLLAREDVAEELVQQAALRALEQEVLPEAPGELRSWLFRVATNLAIDHLRRQATWREGVLDDVRSRVERSEGFVAASRLLAGSPEMRAIARDHLAVCFACTLRSLAPQESAALLLRELYGFTTQEVAEVLGARFAQAKGWIQAARASLQARYQRTCALVTQEGACFQCVELDRFFEAGAGDPLAGTDRSLGARLVVIGRRGDEPLSPWHRQMMKLVGDVLEEEPGGR